MSDELDATAPGQKPPRVGAVEAGEVLAGRYKLVRFVAAGAMGEVWEAEDLSLHEHVALKTVRPEALGPELLERFRHEVKLARRVTHPNVCRVFEFGEHPREGGEKVTFLTMELLGGRSLDDELRRRGRFSTEEALPLLEQLAAGLDAAHAQGIVHRDFKCPNVFLEGKRVVITDFGLARAVGADVRVTTTPQQMMGTPAYMAPEQVLGTEAGPAADVFALGVVAFELVTGKLPFPAETALATALKRLNEPPLSARSLVPELPEAWERALFVAMARQPGDRFVSASQLVAALKEAPRLAPVSLPPRPIPASRAGLRWLALGSAVALAAVGARWWWPAREAVPAANDQLQAAARSVTDSVQRCYQAQLAKTPGLEGRLEFLLQVDARGEQTTVQIERDTMGSPEVAACAMTELRAIKPGPGLASTSLRYPFVFRSPSPVAIAPFENLAHRADAEWLSGGMSEALASKLGQLDDLPLVDRTALRAALAAPAPDGGVSTALMAAEAAGAGRLVRGTFQQVGSKLRIDAELVDVTRGATRATVGVSGEADDVFALQDALAKKLADALAVESTRASEAALGRHAASSLAVLQLLGKASNALDGTNEPADPKKAAALYRQVIELEPGVAEAHLGLAWSLWEEVRDPERLREPLAKALSLRPDYYEAITFSGLVLWFEGKFDEALEAQRRAVKLKPQFAAGYYGLAISYASTRRPDEALVALDRAIELSPRTAEYVTQRAFVLATFNRDLNEAVRLADRATALEGAGAWNQVIRAFVHQMANDPKGCFEALAAARALPGSARFEGLSANVEAACLLRAGKREEARALRASLPAAEPTRGLTLSQLGLESMAHAMRLLEADAGATP